MKKILNKIIYKIVSIDYIYSLLWKTIIRLSFVLRDQRNKYEINRILDAKPSILRIFKDLLVLNGPFKGLKYPRLESFGSQIFPKLLGSYEIELAPVFDRIFKENYLKIIDVGCAEGFYAVGLARIFKEATIYAYDINEKALRFCEEMGEINNVGDRLILGPSFTEKSLVDFNFSEKTLIISDCEGFEKQLFTKQSVEKLKNCDVLIETHDLFDFSISYNLEELFKDTHDLTRILSMDDLQKVKTYKYTELEQLTVEESKIILEESRARIMEWHFYNARNS